MSELERLVARARLGDLAALDDLVGRFQDMAVGYAFSVMGDFHHAEDAAQEAFLIAYRELPKLAEAAAFPAWLRAIVRSACHRMIRRPRIPVAPLDAACDRIDPSPGPHRLAELSEMRAEVRDAIESLPDAEREITVLYYLGDRALKEIGGFLDLPVTTVKNRLHAARKRLRERLIDMVESSLGDRRPSKDGRFAAEVLGEIVDEYRRQRREDPATADRSLLIRGRDRLEEFLARPTIEPGVMRAAWSLLSEMEDSGEAAIDLIARYRTQDLPPSEEAWARFHEVSCLAALGQNDRGVEEQTEFYEWARRVGPGPAAGLSPDFPFHPTDDPDALRMTPESFLLFVMGNGTQAQAWKDAGRGDDWLAIFHDVMASPPPTASSRFRRFNYLRSAVAMCGWLDRTEEGLVIAGRIGALADEEIEWEEAERWRIEEAGLRIRIRTACDDREAARREGMDAIERIHGFERRLDPLTDEQEGRVRGFCQAVGAPLTGARQYDLAIPLFRRVIRQGRGSEWVYLRLAMGLWATEADRTEARDLLRQAVQRHTTGAILAGIEPHPEFAPFVADPDFRAALVV